MFNKNFYLLRKYKIAHQLKINSAYLISTDKGLIYIDKNSYSLLLNIPCFGIACSDENLFFSSSDYFYTYIYKCSVDFKNLKRKPKIKILFKHKIGYFGDRIHQISLNRDFLYFTATYNNSLMRLDLHNNKVTEIYKMKESLYNYKLNHSNQHINSVRVYNNTIYFIYNNAFDYDTDQRVSFVMSINKKNVKRYFINKWGIHDIHSDGKNVFISITFGDENSKQGYILSNSESLHRSMFDSHSLTIRGIAGFKKTELLFGSSNKGYHFKRFNGKSKLILFKHNRLSFEDFYGSQIYDIIQLEKSCDQNSNIDKFLDKISYKTEKEILDN